MIAYIVVWSLFWVGHVLSKVFEYTYVEFVYDMYNWCMTTSCNLQDEYNVKNGPWIPFEEEKESLNSSDSM